jgi:hypothetical protein
MQLVGFNGEPIPGDLYAKVMGPQAQHFRGFTVRFTFIPPEVETFLQDLLALYPPE